MDQPPFGLTIKDGQALLSLEGWPLAPIAQLESLTVEMPALADAATRVPSTLAAIPATPAQRFRNRRGRLTRATITTQLARLARELERPAARARLATAGISDVRIGISEGGFRLVGRASAGDRQAPFTARARLEPRGARQIRLLVDDLRVYGFLTLPAPLVARAVLVGVAEARPGARWWLDFDALEVALLDTFAGHGWRLPDIRQARLQTLDVTAERIALCWVDGSSVDEGAGGAQAGGAGAGDDALAPAAADDSGLDEAEGLLARGDQQGALDAYRRVVTAHPAHDGASHRVLEILVSSAHHLAEADELAAEILTRQPEAPLPLLVRAVAAAERGDAAVAADLYEQIAIMARRRNEEEDIVIARLAAAEQWLRADKTDRAHRLTEQVLATLPAHANGETARVLHRLGDRLIAKGDLGAADQVFESRLALASDDATRAALTIERARTRLLGEGGPAAALVVLNSLPLDRAPEEALLLRADLGEREVSPDDAVPALDELTARARRGGDEKAARRIEDRVLELLARARQADPIEEPAAPQDEDEAEAENEHEAAAAHGAGATPLDRPPSPLATAATTTTTTTTTATATATTSDGFPPSAGDLERLLTSDPTDAAVAGSLADMYGQIAEPQERAEALSSLLRRALGLTPDRRKAIYASLGESAEASGDLDRAEHAYWRAANIEAEPALRASFLVSHARVLLARGETETAISELEEALARVPDHPGALALLGDLAFRLQDWLRARTIYASLAASPGAAEVIPRETLLYRRAQLAQALGEDLEAENHLREVAILNPRHVEARQALADIALGREDFGGAALRLEEVLRLLPLDALDLLLEVRQRLGGVYLQLQDWSSARYYIELVLAQDPTRTTALEILVDVYLRLGAYRDAAEACGRLARVDAQPRHRAEILYRQGEILREQLHDEAGAIDAFLRSSDLDPHFLPSLVRLADFYWRLGAFEDLADLAAELAEAQFAPDADTVDLPVRLAIATRLSSNAGRSADTLPDNTPAAIPASHEAAGEPARRAQALAHAAGFFGARAPAELDPALAPLLSDDVSDDMTARGPTNRLYRALADLVQEDPPGADGKLGAVRALGRAAERLGLLAAARGMYSVLVFVDPDDGAAAALAGLRPAAPIDPLRAAADGAMALLATRQPLAALQSLARDDRRSTRGHRDVGDDREEAHDDADPRADDPSYRRELLRTLPARELIGTLLSVAYRRAVD